MITSMQNKGLGLHSSPLYFTLLRSLNLPKQYLRWTSNICKYVEQMVSTDIPNSENQFDWLKGVDTEATVRNHIRQMLQNIKSQYIQQNCSKKNNLIYRIQTSVPKFFCPKWRKKVCSNKTLQGGHKSKRYTENTSLSNIYRRFYWPGSYALRGVIDQYICLQMGAPLFLLAFFRRKLGSNFNCGSRYSLINF